MRPSRGSDFVGFAVFDCDGNRIGPDQDHPDEAFRLARKTALQTWLQFEVGQIRGVLEDRRTVPLLRFYRGGPPGSASSVVFEAEDFPYLKTEVP